MNRGRTGHLEGGPQILAKANQIRSRAEQMLQEAMAFEQLKRALGTDGARRRGIRGR